MEISSQVQTLCTQGKINLPNELLEKIRVFDKPYVVWELPEVGSKVLILEHIFVDRKRQESRTLYGWEQEPDRQYIVYTVTGYTKSIKEPYAANNFMLLEYSKGKCVFKRRIPTREFACGCMQAMILSNEKEVEYVTTYTSDR